jgi:alpha-amylase
MEGKNFKVYTSKDVNLTTVKAITDNDAEQEDAPTTIPDFCTVTAGETCAFFEAPVTWGSQIYTWAWMNGGDGKNYVGTGWPGVAATLIGTADNGNKVFKWTSTKTTAPDNIIFSDGGNQTDDLKFVNGGYYNQEGLKANVITGIRAITTDRGDAAVYSLDGRRMKHVKPGIYIRNNKKLIIR